MQTLHKSYNVQRSVDDELLRKLLKDRRGVVTERCLLRWPRSKVSSVTNVQIEGDILIGDALERRRVTLWILIVFNRYDFDGSRVR